MTILSSKNEWDPLEKIIVGDATGANWPYHDFDYRIEEVRTLWTESPLPRGPVNERVVAESNEDLQVLADTLTGLGVTVVRPTRNDFVKSQGMYNYCPRDRLIIADNIVIDPCMMYSSRNQELQYLMPHLSSAKEIITMPRDKGMILDAANICRLNDTWLYLVSNSGNKKALMWLQDQLPQIDIVPVNFYAGVHIDSTICPISEDTVIVNATRVNKDNLPDALKDHRIVWVDDCVPQDFVDYPYASKWIGMSVLSVDPSTVIVDRAQTALINTLEQLNFTVIPLELRHSRTLGGGFHCVTLDLRRTHA